MRIALIGYGKMGKTIEKIALERGHVIVSKIDEFNNHDIGELHNKDVDVAIEFTAPTAAFELIHKTIEQGIPVISGTTGWLDKIGEIEALVSAQNGAFFYASNFSIGANLFFELNRKLASIMSESAYSVAIEEIHHKEKKDAPSGTAITLAKDIVKNNGQLEQWVSGYSTNETDLPILSVREDEIPGTHEITYSSAHDKIQIKHTAFTRTGFAEGAIRIAEWIPGKTGMLTMDDFLNS